MARDLNGGRPEPKATAEQAAQMFAQTLGNLLMALGQVNPEDNPQMNGGELLQLAEQTITRLVDGELMLMTVAVDPE